MLAPQITASFAQRVAPALTVEVPYSNEQSAVNPKHAVFSFSYLVSAVRFSWLISPCFTQAISGYTRSAVGGFIAISKAVDTVLG
jgi:hypothetical protein